MDWIDYYGLNPWTLLMKWIPRNTFDDQLILVQVMAWCQHMASLVHKEFSWGMFIHSYSWNSVVLWSLNNLFEDQAPLSKPFVTGGFSSQSKGPVVRKRFPCHDVIVHVLGHDVIIYLPRFQARLLYQTVITSTLDNTG